MKSGTIIHTDKDGVKTTETLADCELDENGNVVKGKIEYSDENGNVVKTEEYKDGSVIDFKEYINFAPNKDGLVTSGTIIHTDENETTTEETLTDCVLQNGGIVSGTKVIKNDKGETIEIREYENCVRDRNGNITNGTLIYKNEDGTTKETRKYYNCTRDENNGVIDGTIEYYKEDGNETRVYDKCTRDENNHVENGTIIIYDGCGDNKTEKEKKVYKDGKLTV